MLKERIRDEVVKATLIVPAKGGRGILVPGGFIVTAAHCVECACDGSMSVGNTKESISTLDVC